MLFNQQASSKIRHNIFAKVDYDQACPDQPVQIVRLILRLICRLPNRFTIRVISGGFLRLLFDQNCHLGSLGCDGRGREGVAMPSGKGRILIVDDDPHAVEILTRMLEREGYECVSAAGGAAALQHVREQAVDVILLDVMMPEMDGLQVCER